MRCLLRPPHPARRRTGPAVGSRNNGCAHVPSLTPRPVGSLSMDPLGFVDGVNLFGYVSNVPTSQFDATGLKGSCERTKFEIIEERGEAIAIAGGITWEPTSSVQAIQSKPTSAVRCEVTRRVRATYDCKCVCTTWFSEDKNYSLTWVATRTQKRSYVTTFNPQTVQVSGPSIGFGIYGLGNVGYTWYAIEQENVAWATGRCRDHKARVGPIQFGKWQEPLPNKRVFPEHLRKKFCKDPERYMDGKDTSSSSGEKSE